MAEQSATPLGLKESEAVVTPAVKEDYGTSTPREESDTNSPPGGQGQQRKRKYEEATDEEKLALNAYHLSNPHLKQRELAEWFKTQYGKSINQSTVSRNLKKFKASPSSKEPGASRLEATPTKRERKSNNPRSPPHKKIQITKQLPPHPPSEVSLPPTPPPRDNRVSPIDPALYDFYLNYRNLHPDASAEECDKEIKEEARKLIASIRPPPPPEKIDDPVIDDVWVTNWKRQHGIPVPSVFGADCFGAPATTTEGQPGSDAGRTCSEETEPRSPVSTVSSSDHRSLELPPIQDATASGQAIQPNGSPETPENRRKRQMEQLKKEIEKRDQRIEHEQRKKESALRKLEKLERTTAATAVAATQ